MRLGGLPWLVKTLTAGVMKTYIIQKGRWLALVALFAILCMGCTRNNGDIGDWFGTWQMTVITADGEPVAGYERNIFWKFQNEIVNLVMVETGEVAHGRNDRWGTWQEEGDRLLVNFTYSDDENSVEAGQYGNSIYAPYPILHIPYGEVSALLIEKRSGNSMTLSYTASDKVTYSYTLKKQ